MITHTTAQSYFQRHKVAPLTGGGQFDVYASKDFVVKAASSTKIRDGARALADPAIAQRMGLPGGALRNVDGIADATLAKLLGEQQALKSNLGRLVVPFEVVDPLMLQVRHFKIWEDSKFLRDAYVQLRIPQEACVPEVCAELHARNDFAALDNLVEQAFATFHGLISRGFFPHDCIPANFCWRDGAVQLLDLGAVWKMGTNVRAVLTTEAREPYVRSNVEEWERVLGGSANPHGPQQHIVQRFTARFRAMNTWSHVHSVEVRGRRAKKNPAELRVPDLFPFEEHPTRHSWFWWK